MGEREQLVRRAKKRDPDAFTELMQLHEKDMLSLIHISHRRHLDVCLESIGICLLEFLQLCGPCQRTYNVDIDAIGTPLGNILFNSSVTMYNT